MDMYHEIQNINKKPQPFEFYTAEELWNNKYTSQKMLECHLNKEIDVSSRNSDFIRSSLEWIINRFRLTKNSAVCDFGCAVGHYTAGYAKTGATVTGLDFSKRSIEYARGRAKDNSHSITYKQMNYLDFSADSEFDLISMIMCDFCALSPQQRRKLLRIFAKSLKTGGHVILDVYSLMGFEQVAEKAIYEKNQLGGFWSEKDYYGFLNTFKYEEEKVGLDKYTLIEPDRTRVVYNWLQYFSVEALTTEFTENGLEVVEIIGDIAGSAYDSKLTEFAIIARKA